MTSTRLLLMVAALAVTGSSCRLFDDSDAPCDAPEHCDVDETCLLGVCQCSNGDVDGDECVDLPDLAAVQQRMDDGGDAEVGDREDVNCDGTVDIEDVNLVIDALCDSNCYRTCPLLDFDESGCTSDRDLAAFQAGADRDIDCDGAIDQADIALVSQSISNEQCPPPCPGE